MWCSANSQTSVWCQQLHMIHRSESRTTVAAPHSLPTSPATTFFDWGGRRASAASPFSDAAQASSEAQAVPSILNNASPLKSSVSSFSDLNSHRRSARVSIPLLWDDVNFESDDSPDGLPKYASGVSQSLFSNKPRFSMQPRPHEQPWSADVKASLNLPLGRPSLLFAVHTMD